MSKAGYAITIMTALEGAFVGAEPAREYNAVRRGKAGISVWQRARPNRIIEGEGGLMAKRSKEMKKAKKQQRKDSRSQKANFGVTHLAAEQRENELRYGKIVSVQPLEGSPVRAADRELGLQSGPKSEERFKYCERCGCNYNEEFPHTCDEWSAASMGKHVCIDCHLHHESTPEELWAIPPKGYCKHLTPEYWEEKGYQRNWGDAAVCAFPHLEILRKADEEETVFIILNGHIRRPVTIEIDRKTGNVCASY